MVAELDFSGQVIVITGAGQGLGRAYAIELAKRGARVVVNDLGASVSGEGGDSGLAQRTAAEIRDLGGEAIGDGSDVATRQGGETVIETALQTWGRLDAVIANAGILRDATFAKLGDEALDAVLRVNLMSAFYVGQPAFRLMREQGDGGRIVFTSSASGILGNFGQANYSAAKSGIMGLTRTLSLEGAKSGIVVNAVAPYASSRLTGRDDRDDTARLSAARAAPIAAILCHPSCPSTGEIFQVGAGLFCRVSIQMTDGYVMKDGGSAEELMANWGHVRGGPTREIPTGGPSLVPFFCERLGVDALR